MIVSNKIAITYIATNKELEFGELEKSIFSLLNNKPSDKYSFDLYIILNHVENQKSIDDLKSKLTGNYYLNSVTVHSLKLTSDEDVFWYPWKNEPKPSLLPELGYTAGANNLFYNAIEYCYDLDIEYDNFLFLESDTKIINSGWFDILIKEIDGKSFFMYGSKYKGMVDTHKKSPYKDHLNGVAIYQKSKQNRELIKKSRKYLSENLNEHGYMNFDIANFLVGSEEGAEMIDSRCIINLSDPHDNGISKAEILEKFPDGLIVHQKNKSEGKIINPEIFSDFKPEKLPIFVCHNLTNTKYLKSVNEHWNIALSKRDDNYDNYLKLKVKVSDSVLATFFCCSCVDLAGNFFNQIDLYDNDLIVVGKQLLYEFIEKKLIDVNSVIIEFNSNKFDHHAFVLFYDVCRLLNLSPWVCSFLDNPFILAKKQFEFLKLETEFRNEKTINKHFFYYMTDRSSINVFGQIFIGEDFLTDIQCYHLSEILKRIKIYDEKLMSRVLDEIGESFFGIPTTEIPVGKVSFTNKNYLKINESSVPDAVIRRFYQRNSQISSVYNNFVEKKIETKSVSSEKNTVPVFLHIPKNAGSFVISSFSRFFVRIYDGDINAQVQRLQIDDEEFGSFTFHVFFIGDKWREDERIHDYKFKAIRSRATNFETLYEYIESNQLVLLSVTMEPVKLNIMKSYEKVWDVCEKADMEPLNFLLLRDPWSRANSVFGYITSKDSEHESTHQAFDIKSFKEYIHSIYLEDSWIIRSLLDLKSAENIDSKNYEKAYNFLEDNKFFIRDVSAVKDVIQHVLSKSFKIDVIDTDFFGEANKTNYRKISRSELSQDDCEKFAIRTQWDQKLYDSFCPKF